MNHGAFQDRRSDLFRETIRYNWLIIVFFMLAGAVAGYFLADVRPAKFTSATSVLVNATVGNPYTPTSNSDTLEMLQTEAVAVTSQEALTEVIDQLGIDLTPAQLRNRINVAVPSNTQALRISYTDTDAKDPPQVVDAVADVFLAQREQRANQAIQNRQESIDAQIAAVQKNLDEAVRDEVDAAIASLNAQIAVLRADRTTNDAQPTDPGRVLTPGFAPVGSQTKHVVTFVIIGVILGAIAGGVVALVRERRRDLIRSADDLADYTMDAPVTSINGKTLDEEALRHLRMRLAPQIRDHGIIALVGLTPGHALRSGVLLGQSLASGGTSVVLIDATGSESGHKDPLDFADREGLAEALMGVSAKVPTAYQVEKNFNYLPAGQDPTQASERLVTDRARTVIHGVAERFDLTMVAAMPLDQIEGESVSRLTSGVLLLVEIGRSTHFNLGAALTTIQSQNRRLLGVFVLPRNK